jgi:hypothetical protein
MLKKYKIEVSRISISGFMKMTSADKRKHHCSQLLLPVELVDPSTSNLAGALLYRCTA